MAIVEKDMAIVDHCTLITGKSQVAPTRYVSLPRLELTAATVSVNVLKMLLKEVNAELTQGMGEFYWPDSQVVFGYIKKNIKQSKVFVAYPMQLIRDHSNINQWHYVNTAENPANFASKGLDTHQKNKVERWFHGPAYLHLNSA